MIKKITIRLLVIAAFVLAANFIYKRWFWKDDAERNGSSLVFTVLEQQDSADMMYFGESSDFSFRHDDSIKLAISAMTAQYYPGLNLVQVSKEAHHARYFWPLIKNIRQDSKVKTFIITMNMRTFDMACIHGRWETSLCKMARFYEPLPPLLNRLFLTLNFYDNKSAEERDKELWKEWTYDTLFLPHWKKYHTVKEWCAEDKFMNPDGSYDMKKRELADHYIKAYGFIIDTLTNPRIKDFDNMVKHLKAAGKNVVLNLLAENTYYADSLVGQDLVDLMQINRRILVDRYTRMGATVVDNFEAVDGWDYTDQNWTTEHYGQKGRSAIAANVADSLRKFYPNEYKSWPAAEWLKNIPRPAEIKQE